MFIRVHSRRVVEQLVQGPAERLVGKIKVRHLDGYATVLGSQRVAQLVAENRYGQHGYAVVHGLDGAVHATVRDK